MISHVDGVRVGSPKEFHAAVAGKTGPVSLRLITRDPSVLVIPPEPPVAPPCRPADASPSEPNIR